ncbi:unnamed protein product [Closterium sp. NIES-54]
MMIPTGNHRCLTVTAPLVQLLLLIALVNSVAGLAPPPRSAKCDYSNGLWMRGGKRFPRYTTTDGQKRVKCPYVRSEYSCERNNRPDWHYKLFRWQPYGCSLSYFSPSGFKFIMKNKKMLLVGDSMMSNFHEALLCAIHTGGFSGQPYTVDIGMSNGIKGMRFPAFSFSLEYYNSPYLVQSRRQTTFSAKRGGHAFEVNVDKMDPKLEAVLGKYDVVVFASGVWWLQNVPRRTQPNIFLVNGQERNLSNVAAHQWGLSTVVNSIKNSNFRGVPMFLSFSPNHSGAKGNPQKGVMLGRGTHVDWIGACGAWYPITSTKKYSYSLDTASEYRDAQKSTLSGTPIRFIQVTDLSGVRPDGHLGPWHEQRENKGSKSPGGQGESPFSGDCTHWCLPGVPDTWVDMLYTHLLLEPSIF